MERVDMATEARLVTITLNPAVDLACTVPEFTTARVNRVVSSRTDAGGKGVNIARLLRQFGLPVTATGFLGQDNPHIFEKLFNDMGIEDAFVRVPGKTRIGIKILDPIAHTTTDLNFPGLSPGETHMAALFDVVEQQLPDAAVVVIAGSVPACLPPKTVGRLVATIKARGVKVFVDTSGPALGHAIAAKPTLIKPNVDELSEYVGRSLTEVGEIQDEARKLLDTGIETVVVSLGERGALFVEREAILFTTPPSIEATSTVGAGDAMVGSLAAGLVLNLPLAERARLATAVSAAVVSQSGPGLPSLDEVKKIEDQVLIHQRIFDGGTDE